MAPVVEPVVAPKAISGDVRSRVRELFANAFGDEHWFAAEQIINAESGFNIYATNPSSGACGLFQSLPCSKVLGTAGTLDNVDGQVQWGINYIRVTYGNPTLAWNFWQGHRWY